VYSLGCILYECLARRQPFAHLAGGPDGSKTYNMLFKVGGRVGGGVGGRVGWGVGGGLGWGWGLGGGVWGGGGRGGLGRFSAALPVCCGKEAASPRVCRAHQADSAALPSSPLQPRPPAPASQIIVAVAIAGERPAIPEAAPPRLADLVRRCWREDPRQRPSVRDVLHSLESQIQVGGQAVSWEREARARARQQGQARAALHACRPPPIGPVVHPQTQTSQQDEVEARAERAGLIRHLTRSTLRAGSGASSVSASGGATSSPHDATTPASAGSGSSLGVEASGSGYGPRGGSGGSASPSLTAVHPAWSSDARNAAATALPGKPPPLPPGAVGASGASSPGGGAWALRNPRRASAGSDASLRGPATPQLHRHSVSEAAGSPRAAHGPPARSSSNLSASSSPRAPPPTPATSAAGAGGSSLDASADGNGSSLAGGFGRGFALGGRFLGLLPSGLPPNARASSNGPPPPPPASPPPPLLARRSTGGALLRHPLPGGLESIPSPGGSEHPSASTLHTGSGGETAPPDVLAAAAAAAVAAAATAPGALPSAPRRGDSADNLGWLTAPAPSGEGGSGLFRGSSATSAASGASGGSLACQASGSGAGVSAGGPPRAPSAASVASSGSGGSGASTAAAQLPPSRSGSGGLGAPRLSRDGPGGSSSGRSAGKHVSFAP
jgi:hypothetical protein